MIRVRTGGDRLPAAPLLALAIGVFVALTAEVLPVGVLSRVAADLGVGVGAAGLLVSAYAVVVMVGSIPLSWVLARWPRRLVLCGLLLGYAVTSAGFAAAPSYPVALAVRLVAGLVHAGFFASVFSAVADVSPPARRGRATALVTLGVTGGLALGVPGGAALAALVGWRGAFGVLAGAFVVMAVVVLRVLPAPSVAPAPDPATGPTPRTARARAVLPVGALVVALTLGHYLPYTYIDLLLERGHIALAATAPVLFAYGLGAAVGSLLAGTRADTAPRRALVVAVVALLVGLLLLATGPSAPVTALAAFVWGAGLGGLTPLLQTIALQAASADLASALVNAAFNAGIAGGALLGAGLLLTDRVWPLPVVGAVLAAGSLLLIPLTRRAATP